MITSPTNPGIKLVRALVAGEPRRRRQERLFVVEGVRAVEEGLAAGEPRLVLYEPETLKRTPRGTALLAQLARLRVAEEVTPQVFSTTSETVHAQGVIAVFPFMEWQAPLPGDPPLLLIVDGVRDPGNLGTLMRTAEGAGVHGLWLSPDSVDLYNPKVIRAAMGAHFRLPTFPDFEWGGLKTELAGLNVLHLAALDVRGGFSYYNLDWRRPTALIVGGEAHGLSRAGLAAATERVTIPMPGGAESLNAAMATGIVLFEALRQRAGNRAVNE